jgi:hypothetical protein
LWFDWKNGPFDFFLEEHRMSNVPFQIEPGSNGQWVVHVGQTPVTVLTHKEADVMASLPDLLSKINSGSARHSDIGRARDVVAVYGAYHVRMAAVRHVESWLDNKVRLDCRV